MIGGGVGDGVRGGEGDGEVVVVAFADENEVILVRMALGEGG